ncbi:Subtilisin-like protease SBT2-3 [Nymphaea thermarum]|nr:Subtilisin-like protease SBT2-3 [Nymphaea thermarum]
MKSIANCSLLCRLSTVGQQVEEELLNLQQGDQSLAQYFASLKSISEQLKALRPPCPTCYKTHGEQSMVAKFLQGLSSEYAVAKAQMLTGAEIPDLVDAYNRLSRLAVTLSSPSSDIHASALAAAGGRGRGLFRGRGMGRGSRGGRGRFQCTYCGKIGHLEDRYWDKHGRPTAAPSLGRNVTSKPGKNPLQSSIGAAQAASSVSSEKGAADRLRTATYSLLLPHILLFSLFSTTLRNMEEEVDYTLPVVEEEAEVLEDAEDFSAHIVVVLILLQYYNDSLVRNTSSNMIIQFGGSARISGGLQPEYNNSAPKILYYSARGPDPETALLDDADFMKPNLVAPGNFIWAAWTSGATDSVEFGGERFAMLSGTSMATPHVTGIAAMIKQKFPNFSPPVIGSALCTTASLYDNQGGPIMAQRTYNNPDLSPSPATPFDMGSGFVNVTAALDPGLILDASYDDFFSFLCGINGSSSTVLNYTSQACGANTMLATDLNLPSITVAKLKQSLVVHRVVKNIAGDESYRVSWSAPYGVSVAIVPNQFFIANRQTQNLTVFMNATMNSTSASFGRIGIYGNRGHVLNVPISVITKTFFNGTDS